MDGWKVMMYNYTIAPQTIHAIPVQSNQIVHVDIWYLRNARIYMACNRDDRLIQNKKTEQLSIDYTSSRRVTVYRTPTPQKSHIDVKNGHSSKKINFPTHHFGYPAVSFQGCNAVHSDITTCPTTDLCRGNMLCHRFGNKAQTHSPVDKNMPVSM